VKPPIVTDAQGVEHKLNYLVRRFAIEYRPFVNKLVAQLNRPELYAEAAKALIFLNADLQSDEHNNFKALASLTQISSLTEKAIRDGRNQRRRSVRTENCSKLPKDLKTSEVAVEVGMSLKEIGELVRKFPRSYKQLLKAEEIEFYIKSKK
jgi:hypothetical protein